MAEAKQKVYNFDEMGEGADRPVGIINGKKYTMYAAMDDMGPKRIAEFYRISRQIDGATEDDVEGMMNALIEITPLIFVDEIPDEALDTLSLKQLRGIYESFSGASAQEEEETQEAEAEAQA